MSSYGGSEGPATEFAITNVNVPDRLDMRDLDDRKQFEEETRRSRVDFSLLRGWAPRIILIAILAAITFVIFEVVDTWRTALSAPQVSLRLSKALGVAVHIDDSRLALTPAPRLVLSKLTIDNSITLEDVSIKLGNRVFAQMLQGRGLSWGEAVVASTTLTLEQCQRIAALLPKLEGALPQSVSTLRFDEVRISDLPWVAGPWEIAVSRSPKGFVAASATEKDDKGFLEVDLTLASDASEIAFQLDGRNWKLPFGASFPMEEVVASGKTSAGHVVLTQYSLGGPWGAIVGDVEAILEPKGNSSAWAVHGTAHSEGLDLEALIRAMAPQLHADDSAQNAGVVLQGTASFTGKLEGHGATLVEAAGASAFQAQVHVRTPVLNGINLGYAATHPSVSGNTSGGSTRFASLETSLLATSSQTLMREINARAGALAAFGQVSMSPTHQISGTLHVDLGTTRILAPIRVGVHGSVVNPEFGR
jgi:hypothetical protein